jgi:hypothetical protein
MLDKGRIVRRIPGMLVETSVCDYHIIKKLLMIFQTVFSFGVSLLMMHEVDTAGLDGKTF